MRPVIRCSNIDRLLSCPGSRTLDAKLAELDDFSGEAAGDSMTWRGNWCHWASAKRLIEQHGAIAPDGLATPKIPSGWHPSPWDERFVDWYVAQVVEHTPSDHALFVEHRFTHAFLTFDLTGQLDCYSLSPDGTEFGINDAKTGVVQVDEAENNWQLAGYCTLLKLAHPKLQRGHVRILQHDADTQFSEMEITDNLDALVNFMEKKVLDALIAWRELETGYKQCRLCQNIQFCPALNKEISEMKMILSEQEVSDLQVTSDLKSLAALAARGRAIAGPIDRLIEALRSRIEVEGPVVLDDGTRIELVEEPGFRVVTAPKVAHALVADKLGEDEAWGTLSMSVKKVEDGLVASGMKRTSKKEESATSWIGQTLGHLIHRPTIKKLKFK